MTAARAEQPGTIPGREWYDADRHWFQLLGFNPGDECAIGRITDRRVEATAAVAFTSTQLREIAAAALDLAEAIENVPGRNRKTSAWHQRRGEQLLRESDREDDAEWATARAEQAQAHFLAAMSGKTLAQGSGVVIHQHNGPSREDTT